MDFPFVSMNVMSVFLHRLVAQSAIGFLAVALCASVSIDGSSAVVAQAAGGDGPADPAATEALAGGENAVGDEVEQKAQRRQSVFDQLIQELDNLVPGEFEEGSRQKAELVRAVNAFLDSDIKTLNEIFDEQAAFDPDFPPRHLLLASMSYRINDPRQGRELLEKAATKSPKYPGTYAAFARLALGEGRIADAMVQLEKCARVVGENKVSDKAKKHFARQYVTGMMHVALAQERYRDARDFFKRHMELNPDDLKAFLTGGEIEFKAGNLAQSQSYLEQLKEAVPEARPFESIFARWFRENGNSQAAGKWVVAAAEKYPDDMVSQMDYANWLMVKNDLAAVQATLAKVEALTGETANTRVLKSQLAFADNNIAQAEQLLEKIVADSNGDNLEAVNLYSLALIESADPEKHQKAQEIAQQTLGKAPRNPTAQATLGYILLRQGNTDQAQRLLLPAVRRKRVSAEVAYFFGYMMNTLGKKEAARKALQSALENEGVFLYRKRCQQLLEQLGGPIVSDEPEPAVPMPLPEP